MSSSGVVSLVASANCYFLNSKFKIVEPIFLSRPDLVNGIPVFFAIVCFTCEIPVALFHEKLRPGMPVVDFLAISLYVTSKFLRYF